MEEITPEQFAQLTGEQARPSEGKSSVKVVWGWVYLIKAAFNEERIAEDR